VEIAMRLQNGTGILGDRLSAGGGSLMASKSAGDGGNGLQMATMNNTYNYNTGSATTLPVAAPAPAPEASELARNLSDPAITFATADNATKAALGPTGPAADAAGQAAGSASLPPVDTGAAQSLLPYDLLNHWGLWFLTGCLLIIGIMVVYDLYTRRKGGKK
jgi:hypothetical protein